MLPKTVVKIGLLACGLGLIVACQNTDQASLEEGVRQDIVAQLNEELSPEEQLAADRNRKGALGDMVLGNPDAPVTLIEIGSLTCSHCATFHINHFSAIKEKFIDTGKVKFIFRALPTSPPNKSLYAAMYSRCLTNQNGDEAFYTMTDALFKEQSAWTYSRTTVQYINDIATDLGFNIDNMATCARRQEIANVINANSVEARDKYGVTGTPSFILDGEKLNLSNYTELEGILESAINGDHPKETARKYQ